MLKNLSSLYTPELLHAVAWMGHCDEILIADANLPAVSMAQRLVRLNGIGSQLSWKNKGEKSDDKDTGSWSAVSEKTAIKYARDLLNKTTGKKKKPACQKKPEPQPPKYEELVNTQPFGAKFVRGGGCSPR
jgi:RbsD / FucU transport protein family